jgi:hypothetical protein
VGEEGQCGCPGHQFSIRLLDVTYPPALAPLYSEGEWNTFIAGINESLTSTAVPSCPLCFLMPMPPICCLLPWLRDSNAAEREEQIQTRIEKENTRLVRVGLQWSDAEFIQGSTCGLRSIPLLKSTLTLSLDLEARASFELDNPQATQWMAQKLVEQSQAMPLSMEITAPPPGTGSIRSDTIQHDIPPGTASSLGPANASDSVLSMRSSHSDTVETQQRLLIRQTSQLRKASASRGEPYALTGTPQHDPMRWAQSTASSHSPQITPQLTPQLRPADELKLPLAPLHPQLSPPLQRMV